jgi:hypothetical protein
MMRRGGGGRGRRQRGRTWRGRTGRREDGREAEKERVESAEILHQKRERRWSLEEMGWEGGRGREDSGERGGNIDCKGAPMEWRVG